jgi:glutathione S-transferase
MSYKRVMAIDLHHHPYSRAATVLWMLEEVEAKYTLNYVDILSGAQKSPEFLSLNPMGKLPTIVDSGVVVTETAAIGLYLADRYAAGRLAPALDSPSRGTYLRWSLFGAAVVEPCLIAHNAKWDYKSGSVGWGDHASMLAALKSALGDGEFILGDTFSMADIILGSTIRSLLQFKMLEACPEFDSYVSRLESRPALKTADARNAEIATEHGLDASP